MSHFATRHVRRLLLGAALLLASTAAQAQATRTWVSGVGDDANPCSRTAPCKTFAGAISKTATAGIISVLDPGGFGALNITKSITIDGGGLEGSILGGGTTGVLVNGDGISVTLRNLHINGAPGTGLNGVRFLNGHDLHIEDCIISQFGGTNGNGILMDATSAGYHHLYVSNSTIINNGSGGATEGGGIRIKPAGASTYAYAYIERSRIDGNKGYGVKATDNSFVSISESKIQGNARSGVSVVSTTLLADVSIHDSALNANGIEFSASDASLLVSGGNGIAHISGNAISQNEVGVKRVSSGHIFSYGNNRMMDNTTNGTVDGPDTSL
jgi:hypothetical protein